MGREKYQLEGYSFSDRMEYERAVKEKETITYLMANTNSTDGKALLKLYNRSIEKSSFRTVIGLEYMANLRKHLVSSGIVGADALAPVPVTHTSAAKKESGAPSQEELKTRVKHYQEAYESARTGRMIRNMVIAVLLAVIFAMLLITYRSQYSVFTYFTDYKEKMRNELIDEYEQWQEELEQKEKDLRQREEKLEEGKNR